jgi:phosphatidylinositol alpha-mannosyltransferase
LGLWLRRSVVRFDEIVSVSTTAADFARAMFGIETDVLPNVIDYARFHDAMPLPGDGDGRLTILFLGRLVTRKGCAALLAATAKLVTDPGLPPFRLLVCGTGPLRHKLETFTQVHGLGGVVTFTGLVPEQDKPRYFASADISVFPSLAGESFGIVLLEAMASGRAAVLAGDNPGYRSVLGPCPQLLFDPRDPVSLARKLGRYLADAPLTRRKAAWGAEFTRDFDVEIIGRQLLGVYMRAVRRRRQR